MRWTGSVVVSCMLALAGCAEAPVVPPVAPEVSSRPPREPIPNWTPAKPSTFTVVATGDVLIHPALTTQAELDGGGSRDYRAILAGVKPIIEAADLAICHLDVPLATAEGPFSGFPTFRAPPEVATGLADAGYDECSTASNHTLDGGAAGVRSTLDALDAAGVEHVGSARSEQEARAPKVIDLDWVKVGHVSFTYGVNAGTELTAEPWLANLLSLDRVLAAAREAKQAGAEVVIASLHWGNEFQPEPTDQQLTLARELLADPAVDLIIGHHAHVVQPFEQINGKWVAYGLGNHLARHAEPRGTSEEGVIARFRFNRDAQGQWRADHVDYVPTLIEIGPPIRLVDLTVAPNSERKATALRRIDDVVLSRGAKLTKAIR